MYNLIGAQSVELYIGEDRSGKTLCMTADTYEETKNLPQIKIYSNYRLNDKFFKNWQLISKKDLVMFWKNKEEFTDCIFLIDEVHQWLDARNFMKKENKAIGYFLGQMGKRGNVFRGTTHDKDLVEFRLRKYCKKETYIFKGLLQKDGRFKMLLNNNRLLTPEENERLLIEKQVILKKLIKTNFLPEYSYINLPTSYVQARDYFDLYDTEELIITDEEFTGDEEDE